MQEKKKKAIGREGKHNQMKWIELSQYSKRKDHICITTLDMYKYIRTCVWELSMNNRAENKKAMSSDCDKESERTVVILYGYVKEFNKFEGNARFKKEERILQAAFKWREEEFRMRLHKR